MWALLDVVIMSKENGINWIDLSQDRDYWRALVHAALNLRVPYAS